MTGPENIDGHLLARGKVLPVMEEFYTLQGEGFHTGKAAYFIRIGGCDVGCRWCDVKESWNASLFPPVAVEEVVQRAARYPAAAVVITGGEPLLYNLDLLCDLLHAAGITIFVETSGSQPPAGNFDWICVSPKKDMPPLPSMLSMASELKMIVHDETDFSWAEENAAKVQAGCILYLQPEWSRHRIMMPVIVDYIKAHPEWKISLQSHKYMHIP